MEKFGIFELLDALSTLTSDTESSPAPGAPSPPPAEQDSAFAPPEYGTEKPPRTAGGRETDALADFLARHDAVAKKAKK